MATIFISYRRENCAGEARALFNDMRERLSENSVFMDVDSIDLGRDFRSALQRTLATCDIVLVLIGRNWADAKDEEGQTRLEDPGDFVRLEIEAALKRDIIVMPVLVQGAHMPAAAQLPPEIRDLVYRNAFELSHNRWESDLGEMLRRLHLDLTAAGIAGQRLGGATAASKVAVAPTTRPPEPHLIHPRSIRLTRRRALEIAVGVALGAGALTFAVPSVKRLLSRPALRVIHFDVASVDEKGIRNPSERYSAAVFSETIGLNAQLEMVAIPSGSFTMGSPPDEPERQLNEGPQHHVSIPAFFIGASPVSQAQWAAVVLAHPDRILRDLAPMPAFFNGIDLPVETVSWNQAEEFCLRLAAITGRPYRLPSEAEWEYACRARTVTAFNVGPTITPELANYCGTGGAVCGDDNGKSVASDVYAGVRYTSGAYGQGPIGIFRGTTTRPETFPRNRFGLYDMHGNVWEYCLDKSSDDYSQSPLDDSANLSGPPDMPRILRGGSWSNNPAICRSAYRDHNVPGDPGWQGRCGFRVACTF